MEFTMPARSLLAIFGRASVVLIFVALGGCNRDDRIPVHPVEGQFTWRGQPLPNAFIVLHPQNAADTRLLPARAQTDASGKFYATTYEQADGAAAGEYRVTVEYYRPIQNGSSLEPGPNVLPPKFSRPETSDITVRVSTGKNTLPTIALR
jgi:hypothetical protein